jgi:Asp-tRNA(Asn)/Glu-tRNA(Gln) amidotransferase C subunit
VIVEDQLRKIDREYRFNLTEEEIQSLVQRAEEFELLFRCLYDVDLSDTPPLLKLDKR